MILSLGSNLEDRRAHLEGGLRALVEVLTLERVSRVVESPPWGPVLQPHYLNVLVRGGTVSAPGALLAELHGIEEAAGRARGVRFGPRTLDIDIIFFGEIRMRTPTLTIPHPRWRARGFVHGLLPDVAVGMADPVTGESLDRDPPGAPLPEGLREVDPLAIPGSVARPPRSVREDGP